MAGLYRTDFFCCPLQDYLAHIIDQCDLSIRPEQVCALFGNIEDIYEFNRCQQLFDSQNCNLQPECSDSSRCWTAAVTTATDALLFPITMTT